MFVVCEKWVETRTDCYIDPSSSLGHSSTSFTSWLGLLNRGSLRAQSPQSAAVSHFDILSPTDSNSPSTWFYYFLTSTCFRLFPLIYTGASLDWRLGRGSIYNNIWTIDLIFIIILTTFQPICLSAFFWCFMSNSGVRTESQTEPFIWTSGVDCSSSVNHYRVQVLSYSTHILANLTCCWDWTCHQKMMSLRNMARTHGAVDKAFSRKVLLSEIINRAIKGYTTLLTAPEVEPHHRTQFNVIFRILSFTLIH